MDVQSATTYNSFQVVKARIGRDGCLLMICKWGAALYRGEQIGEELRECDCSKGASTGYWLGNKETP